MSNKNAPKQSELLDSEKIERTPAVANARKDFKRGRALALPTLSVKNMKEGESIFVRLLEAPVTKIQQDKKGVSKIDPDTGEILSITICKVLDLQRDVSGELVLGFIVVKALAEKFPDPAKMVGKSFEFVKGEKKNRTVMWEVYELDEA